MIEVEPAGGIPAIGFFGHRRADDANGGIGHARHERGGTFGRDGQVQDRPDNAGLLVLAVAFHHGIKTVLRGERIARCGTAERRADDPPIRLAGGETAVDIDGLVGTMEVADAEMDDARRYRCAVVIGQCRVSRCLHRAVRKPLSPSHADRPSRAAGSHRPLVN